MKKHKSPAKRALRGGESVVRVGDKIRFIPAGFVDTKDSKYNKAVTGTVFYVNQEHRHYGVEAELWGHTLRESFKF